MTSILPKITELENHLAKAAPEERGYVVQTVFETVSLDLCKSPFPVVGNENQINVIESTLKSMNDFKFNVAVLMLLESPFEEVETALEKSGNSNDSAFGFPALHFAAANTNAMERMNLLLRDDANIDGVDKNGNTPLHVALMMDLPEVCDYLIDHGASLDCLNNDSWSFLHLSAKHGHLKFARLLSVCSAEVDSMNAEKKTPLGLAAAHGHLEVVQFLIDNGAAIEHQDSDGSSPLLEASKNGHLDVVKYLCSLGVEVKSTDTKGRTAINYAAAGGFTEIVKVLFSHGADLDRIDNNGVTPVHVAALRGHFSSLKYIVEQGADVEIASISSTTPLLAAAVADHEDIVKYLLEQGATAVITDVKGMTPLYAAALRGNDELMKCLFESLTTDEDLDSVKPGILEALGDNEINTAIGLASLLNPDFASIRGLLEYITEVPVTDECLPADILNRLHPDFDKSMLSIGLHLADLEDQIEHKLTTLVGMLCASEDHSLVSPSLRQIATHLHQQNSRFYFSNLLPVAGRLCSAFVEEEATDMDYTGVINALFVDSGYLVDNYPEFVGNIKSVALLGM